MPCPNCGSDNREGAKFCDQCGFPLGGAIARAAAENKALDPEPAEELDREAKPEDSGGELQRDLPAENTADGEEGQDQPASPEADLDDPASFEQVGEEDLQTEADQEVADLRAGEETAPAGETHVIGEVDEPEIATQVAVDGSDAKVETQMEGDDAKPEGATQDACDQAEGITQVIGTEAEAKAEDITQVIDAPKQDADITRSFDEDDFAGFTKTPDDSFSFADPLNYDGEGRGPLSTQEAGFTMKMPRVESEPAEKSRDFMASQTVPKKSHGKTIGIIVAIVAVIAVVAVALYAFGIVGGKPIPDVTNMTEHDARAILEESGFKVRSTQVKSDDTEGLVLIMDPAAGSRANEGTEVVIHIATARLIPDVIGKTSEEATAMLTEEGYDTITTQKVKSDGDENLVLAVAPEVGSRAKSSIEVRLDVSEAYRVPDISGLGWDAAIAAVKDAGLVPEIVYINTDYYIEGTIIGTSPEAGTVVDEGSTVAINVAQSRATVLTSLTQNLLVPGSTINIGGYNYTIDALNSVSYAGNDTVAFTLTGRPYVSLFGEVIHASPQTVNGQVVWSPSNQVVSIT